MDFHLCKFGAWYSSWYVMRGEVVIELMNEQVSYTLSTPILCLV